MAIKMNINTKFNVGDEVYPIAQCQEKNWVRCDFCDGRDDIASSDNLSCILGNNGKSITCPVCNGYGGFYEKSTRKWKPVGHAILMRMELCVSDEFEKNFVEVCVCRDFQKETEHQFAADNVFDSEKEAEDECYKRNNLDELLGEELRNLINIHNYGGSE
jgi:hypothetical protein